MKSPFRNRSETAAVTSSQNACPTFSWNPLVAQDDEPPAGGNEGRRGRRSGGRWRPCRAAGRPSRRSSGCRPRRRCDGDPDLARGAALGLPDRGLHRLVVDQLPQSPSPHRGLTIPRWRRRHRTVHRRPRIRLPLHPAPSSSASPGEDADEEVERQAGVRREEDQEPHDEESGEDELERGLSSARP